MAGFPDILNYFRHNGAFGTGKTPNFRAQRHCDKCFTSYKRISNSNTPRLYSQWLISVIYWLINHCTDRTRTGVTSFGSHFEFHDVIYHIPHCNVDNRRCNVVFTTTWRSKCTLKYAFQSKQDLREILTVCSKWRNRYRLWRIRSYF